MRMRRSNSITSDRSRGWMNQICPVSCQRWVLSLLTLSSLGFTGCGGGSNAGSGPVTTTQAPTPVITTAAAQNGAVIVSMSDSSAGATMY